MANAEIPKVVFVLGGPGAGKGTQCANIVKEFGFAHLSAGELLREELKNPVPSKDREQIQYCFDNNKIVPVDITLNLILTEMEKSSKKKFLIDGFPRNKENLDGWEHKMTGKVDLLFVLFFDCANDTCVQRCLARGAQGGGRTDDNSEVLEKRIQSHIKDTMPIIKHFEKINLVRWVDANKTPESVFDEVKNIFQGL